MSSPTKNVADERAAADLRVASPSLGILEELDLHNTVTSIEARLDSMEIDLARHAGSREDDARRMAGEMAVMKARVEDALTAFAATAEELRDAAKDLDKKVAQRGPRVNVTGMRAEVDARIEGVTAGIGDVLDSVANELGARIERLGEQMREMQQGIASVAMAMDGITDRLVALEANPPRRR